MSDELEQEEELTQDHCWRCIPISYDNYPQEQSDRYDGSVFGHLSGFESPHFLYRRFHRNYNKALALTKLNKFEIDPDEESIGLDSEVADVAAAAFDLKVLSFHHSLVFLISAFEAFLKDSFNEVLLVQNRTIPNKTNEQIIRKYNFQNYESINKAFSWLFNDPQSNLVTADIQGPLIKRHKIVHESFYDPDFSEAELNQYFLVILMEADRLHFYLEDNGFYKSIIPNQ